MYSTATPSILVLEKLVQKLWEFLPSPVRGVVMCRECVYLLGHGEEGGANWAVGDGGKSCRGRVRHF